MKLVKINSCKGFIVSLNLLESDAKILKSIKVKGESHCNSRSDIAGTLST